ncbi:MAG: shikimate dehydrogenase [Deltaproteobacteria bacterium]|nr:MAG: shikimate dehydrogenase [Deltaproteobacteria bacterium]
MKMAASRVHARLFGVLGDPVDHSLSPAMQNAAFAAARLPHLYLRYRVAPPALEEALADARRLRMGGLNLTVPLKETALPLCDVLTAEARRIGAVNTLLFRGDRLVGDNTDGRGFLRALGDRVRLGGAHTVLIGAGGSARAVGAALVHAGCGRITVANRTPGRGEQLAARLATLGCPDTRAISLAGLAGGDPLADAALVVNTTPLGLGGARLALRHGASPPRCLFIDLVYGTQPTPFLAAAVRAGRATLDGGPMLLHQGALAFETWTGRRAPLAAMARALSDAGLVLTQPRAARSVRARRPPRP